MAEKVKKEKKAEANKAIYKLQLTICNTLTEGKSETVIKTDETIFIGKALKKSNKELGDAS